jgi:methyl-accepting chemotaxis protein
VAQEVKSLANQTARATDDIAQKIAAIQSATRSTVATNDSIRATVREVQQSATRIRQAMEVQAQTVTMITAAVDETALAADTMSSTIAAIRADTETVATEIDELETGFDNVNAKLVKLQDATGDYVRLVA